MNAVRYTSPKAGHSLAIERRYENRNRALVLLASGEEAATSGLCAVDLSLKAIVQMGGAEGVASMPLEKARGGIAAALVPACDVEMADGQYNEEYLASLREVLKSMESNNMDVIIVPVLSGSKTLDILQFTASMAHTARRIKDCKSVIGFALPDDAAKSKEDISSFIDALSVKHPQYVYFCSKKTSDVRLIPYSLR